MMFDDGDEYVMSAGPDPTERCTCTYGAYARIDGGTGWDIARFDPACPEHGATGAEDENHV